MTFHLYTFLDGERVVVSNRLVETLPAEVREKYRPVAVVDPADDESTSRLWRLLPDSLVSIDQLQAALREFAAPSCTAAVTVDEVVRPCELGGDHDGEHSVHHGRTRVTWGA